METGFTYIRKSKRCLRVSIHLVQKKGTHKEWYPNGTLKSTGKYEGGVENGKWKFFTEDGILKYTYVYRYGKLWKVDGRRVARKRDSLRN